MLIRIILFFSIFLLIDFYVFKGVRTLSSSLDSSIRQIIHWIYWLLSLCILAALVYSILTFDRSRTLKNSFFPFLAAVFILFIVPKLVFAFILILEDLFRLTKAMGIFVGQFFYKPLAGSQYIESRRLFISQIGMALAAIPFFSILYGVTKGKYNFKVRRIILEFDDLPENFNGFTITQISDIHAGSLDNKSEVEKGVRMINEQRSDIIVFTGDLVNNTANEMDPWLEIFKQLKAPLGKFSILGNHDYGDYIQWSSEQKKNENFNAIKQVHHQLGFQLLLNENQFITKENQQIALIGVENWGLAPFPQKGDLKIAGRGINPSLFKILLSHDPSHWDHEVLRNNHPIHLTLSGHTHGMQFGIEIPGFRWSPVKYRYPRWAGLYQEGKKFLYVNRGFGFLGFPGRVGIWPEISVIELRKSNVNL